MKSNFIRAIALLACSGFIASALAACSMTDELNCKFTLGQSPATVSREVAVIASPTANFVNFSKVTDNAGSAIKEAISETGTQLSVVLGDGDPSIISTSFIEFPAGDSETDKKNTINRAYGNVGRVAKCATDSTNPLKATSEVDELAALRVAADSFKSSDAKREIFVLSNGIQTAGQYLMNKSGIPSVSDVQAVVDQLKSQKALPDLRGAVVSWFGLGQTDKVLQRTLNQQSIDALEAFWRAAIKSSNGTLQTVNRQIEFAAPQANAIPASVISGLKNACTFTLGQDSGFNFQPDQATFVNVDLARSGAKKMVAELKSAGCSGDLHVTGYVASGAPKNGYVIGNPDSVALSLKRAEAFKALLVEEGAPGAVTAHGGGKGPENDWNSDGSFNEDAGKKNRIVVISQ